MTKYMIIAIVVLGALLAGMTNLWLGARDDVAKSEVARKSDAKTFRLEITGLEAEKKALKDNIDFRQKSLDDYKAANSKIITKLEKKNAAYDKWRTTLASRTLRKPEVTARAATAAISRRMRRTCTITGGQERDCASTTKAKAPVASSDHPKPAKRDRGDARSNKVVEPGDR